MVGIFGWSRKLKMAWQRASMVQQYHLPNFAAEKLQNVFHICCSFFFKSSHKKVQNNKQQKQFEFLFPKKFCFEKNFELFGLEIRRKKTKACFFALIFLAACHWNHIDWIPNVLFQFYLTGEKSKTIQRMIW